jgi:hypothetical protein
MAGDFKGGDINAVLRLVRSLAPPDDGDVQLSILTLALVTACRSIGISKEDALPIIAECFDDKTTLVLLDSPAALGS